MANLATAGSIGFTIEVMKVLAGTSGRTPAWSTVASKGEMQDTYGHTPVKKAFEQGDVYGVGYDEERAARRRLRLGIIGAGPVVQSKHWPAIKRLQAIWEPVEVAAFALRTPPRPKRCGRCSAVAGTRTIGRCWPTSRWMA